MSLPLAWAVPFCGCIEHPALEATRLDQLQDSYEGSSNNVVQFFVGCGAQTGDRRPRWPGLCARQRGYRGHRQARFHQRADIAAGLRLLRQITVLLSWLSLRSRMTWESPEHGCGIALRQPFDCLVFVYGLRDPDPCWDRDWNIRPSRFPSVGRSSRNCRVRPRHGATGGSLPTPLSRTTSIRSATSSAVKLKARTVGRPGRVGAPMLAA